VRALRLQQIPFFHSRLRIGTDGYVIGLENVGLFWHFVDVLWILIFRCGTWLAAGYEKVVERTDGRVVRAVRIDAVVGGSGGGRMASKYRLNSRRADCRREITAYPLALQGVRRLRPEFVGNRYCPSRSTIHR
jgi:hypothetical protein